MSGEGSEAEAVCAPELSLRARHRALGKHDWKVSGTDSENSCPLPKLTKVRQQLRTGDAGRSGVEEGAAGAGTSLFGLWWQHTADGQLIQQTFMSSQPGGWDCHGRDADTLGFEEG